MGVSDGRWAGTDVPGDIWVGAEVDVEIGLVEVGATTVVEAEGAHPDIHNNVISNITQTSLCEK